MECRYSSQRTNNLKPLKHSKQTNYPFLLGLGFFMPKNKRFIIYYLCSMDVLEAADRLSKVNVTSVLVKILKQAKTKKYITYLNTKVQLFDYGEDARGVQLAAVGGGYAPSTIRIKSRKGQPTNRVTLKDTGDFYKSFDVQVKPNADFSITSDSIKNGVDLHKRWGENIEGLQPENVVLVMDYLETEFYKNVFRGL